MPGADPEFFQEEIRAALDTHVVGTYIAGQHMAPHNELKRGSAELMILSALEARARHGYEVAKLIDDRSGGILRFHVASLYPMLYRMERRGWIEGKWVEKAGQRRRRYYTLTDDGRTVLGEQRASWQELLTALQRVTGVSTPE
jgi:PadR family transcriptional regulator PadR